jgi:hypothetical protein
MAILAGYYFENDSDYGPGELMLDYAEGERLEVSEETERRWRQVYGQWLVVKAEIEHEIEKIHSQRIKEQREKAWPHLKWFEEHNRKLREDPSYFYPHDTIQFGDTSYSVSNKR